MLIFSRKVGESFRIGDDITVTLLESRNGGSRIGIDAPLTTDVHRQEVYERIKAEQPKMKITHKRKKNYVRG